MLPVQAGQCLVSILFVLRSPVGADVRVELRARLQSNNRPKPAVLGLAGSSCHSALLAALTL